MRAGILAQRSAQRSFVEAEFYDDFAVGWNELFEESPFCLLKFPNPGLVPKAFFRTCTRHLRYRSPKPLRSLILAQFWRFLLP